MNRPQPLQLQTTPIFEACATRLSVNSSGVSHLRNASRVKLPHQGSHGAKPIVLCGARMRPLALCFGGIHAARVLVMQARLLHTILLFIIIISGGDAAAYDLARCTACQNRARDCFSNAESISADISNGGSAVAKMSLYRTCLRLSDTCNKICSDPCTPDRHNSEGWCCSLTSSPDAKCENPETGEVLTLIELIERRMKNLK